MSTASFRIERPKPHSKRHFGSSRAVVALVASASFLVVFAVAHRFTRWLTSTPLFALSEIHIDGNREVSEVELLRYLDVPEGANLFALALPVLKANILRHPWLKDAALERTLPSALNLHVVEQEPKGIVELFERYVVNAEGEPFARARGEDDKRFATISGLSRDTFERSPRSSKRLILLALDFQEEARAQGVNLRRITVDPVLGLSAELQWSSGEPQGSPWIHATFAESAFGDKLRRLKTAHALLQEQGKTPLQYSLDNARHPDWVVAHLPKATRVQVH